jgi:hypothetical protein
MKRFVILTVVLGCLLLPAVTLAGPSAVKPNSPGMKEYLVTVPHTAAECVNVLEDFRSNSALSKFEFGCKSGDHTAYRMVSARSAEEALALVPPKERSRAKAVELHKFTIEELGQLHKMLNKK